jgi:hypothetical protein
MQDYQLSAHIQSQAVIILMLSLQGGKGTMSQGRLSREEMITLVRKIVQAEGTEAEQDADVALFSSQLRTPGRC